MSNETLFYVCGAVLAVSALLVTFVGLKTKDFPGKALPVVILWFAIFVAAASTFAVRYSGEEHEAKAAEYAKFNEELEKEESTGGFSNEGGALGGEREEGEEEAEKGGEGAEEEEPVGPTTGSKEDEGEASGKGGVTQGKEGSQGSSKPSSGPQASTTLELAADESALAFDKTALSAKPGEVTIDFNNPSPIPHNVVIMKDGKELAGFDPITEGEEEVSAELEAGTYTFICSVPGHAEAGMEGTLTVK
ncbi:MAG TPA: plastocyanin/azurin family copper-binding protein [Solirubrobacterales bacterium]|jgi:plastocyanin|nr:plastocyanin/azurin family copper-binding protein [Solirubrobacterales bacterium]